MYMKTLLTRDYILREMGNLAAPGINTDIIFHNCLQINVLAVIDGVSYYVSWTHGRLVLCKLVYLQLQKLGMAEHNMATHSFHAILIILSYVMYNSNQNTYRLIARITDYNYAL